MAVEAQGKRLQIEGLFAILIGAAIRDRQRQCLFQGENGRATFIRARLAEL